MAHRNQITVSKLSPNLGGPGGGGGILPPPLVGVPLITQKG